MLEGRNLRKTYRLSRQNSVEALAASTSTSRPARWSRSWARPGSGKSTLMHILGLLHSPDRDAVPAGELRIDGRDMTRLSDGERTRMRAQQMGFVFQSFNLVPTLTAIENVALAAEYAGVPGRTARRKRALTPSPRSDSPIGQTTDRWSFRAASSSASRSRVRSSTSRNC